MKNLILMLFILIVFSGCDKLLGMYFGTPVENSSLQLPRESEETFNIDSNTYQLILLNNSDTYFFKGNQIEDGRFVKYRDLSAELTSKLKESKTGKFSIVLKPSDRFSYKSIIDLLDLMTILQIENYKMVELSTSDKEFIDNLR